MQGVTIFTPTYNRAYSLPRLYRSLLGQDDYRFEWIVVDDESEDNTHSLVESWARTTVLFPIRFFTMEHGGKQRAINYGVEKASFPLFFIVDSDDFLTTDAVRKILAWSEPIFEMPSVAGVSGARGNKDFEYLFSPPDYKDDFVEISNLNRKRYKLGADMAEVYKTDVIKKYPFPVWPGETFTPENVVWDQMALDGYRLRWYKDIIYICEYLDDGLTKGGIRLYKNNLIGCAMSQDVVARSSNSVRKRIFAILEMDVACVLKNDFRFLRQSSYPFWSYFFLPAAWLISWHRRKRVLNNSQ